MPSYCLIPQLADAFKQRLIDGTVDPAKLEKATSQERREFFAEFLGEENAKNVNALFESKMLLKNQQQGYVTWAKTVVGIKPEVRRDIISKIERLDKVLNPTEEKTFLNDLANKRLGLDVTYEEAQRVTEGVKEVKALEAKIPADAPLRSKERLEYGFKKALFQEYLKELKAKSTAPSFKEWITGPSRIIKDVAGTTKSILASLDNSFFGRQGIKMLYTNPDIWVKGFAKSWGDIGKSLVNVDPMIPIKADIYSRPNALNGKYKAGKYALDLATEEAYPTSYPERIPLLGRLFKASEAAFNGGALRMRADYADRLINRAERFGLDTLDATQAEAIGNLVNSMTGRGDIGRASGDVVNASFFSVRFLKSNFDTLTAHTFDSKATKFTRVQAAANLVQIVATTAAILWTAQQLWGDDAVDWDSKSANFGKIKIGNTRFDITGGMGSLVTLASRITPSIHNGEWGFWSKSSVSGKYTKLNSGKYGAQTALDAVDSFWQGKLSPFAGLFRDAWKGTDFSGDKSTPGNLLKNVITPLPIQTFEQLKNATNGANTLATMILEELGIGTNTYGK